MHTCLYVQYGCGFRAPEGWRNFDASPTLRFERMPLLGRLYSKNSTRFPANVEYGDIVKGLPIANNSCNGVYCSHVLEHLALDDFRTALRATYRMLNIGGIFRLVLPDLEYSIRQYIGDASANAAPRFLKETALGQETRPRKFKDFLISYLGSSQHRWMWDFKSIDFELQRAGFDQIRKAGFNDSADVMFQAVEEKERWDHCLGLECKRPKHEGSEFLSHRGA